MVQLHSKEFSAPMPFSLATSIFCFTLQGSNYYQQLWHINFQFSHNHQNFFFSEKHSQDFNLFFLYINNYYETSLPLFLFHCFVFQYPVQPFRFSFSVLLIIFACGTEQWEAAISTLSIINVSLLVNHYSSIFFLMDINNSFLNGQVSWLTHINNLTFL